MVRALRLRALCRRAGPHLGDARRSGVTDAQTERRYRAESLVLRPAQARHRRHQIDRSEISGARALHDPLGGGHPAPGVQGAAALVRERRDAGLPLTARALFSLVARQAPDRLEPGHGGAAPDLPAWRELPPLSNAAPANAPHLRLVAFARGKEGRAAVGTEILTALAAAVAGLDVDLGRTAGETNIGAGGEHGDAERRAGERLAIRAVTDRHLGRIDLRLEPHIATVASAVDLHRAFLQGTVRAYKGCPPAQARIAAVGSFVSVHSRGRFA